MHLSLRCRWRQQQHGCCDDNTKAFFSSKKRRAKTQVHMSNHYLRTKNIISIQKQTCTSITLLLNKENQNWTYSPKIHKTAREMWMTLCPFVSSIDHSRLSLLTRTYTDIYLYNFIYIATVNNIKHLRLYKGK